VLRLKRRAKYILAFLEGGEVLILHLGMSGRFTIIDALGRMSGLGEFYDESMAPEGGNGPHDHVVFTREDGLRVVYTDPRRFGLMDLVGETSLASHKLLAEIGVEPLGNEFDALYLAEALRGKKAPLKAALLDQRLIAGLGNIYVCEALNLAGIAPGRAGGHIGRARLDRLVEAVKAVLLAAIRAGGSTLRDYAQPNGELGYFSAEWRVYGREGQPCPRCDATIRRRVDSGRSTFYCGKCQR